MTWIQAFLLTQLVEVPVYLAFMRGSPLSVAMRLAVGFGASALTHPFVWFVFPSLVRSLGWWGYFGVAETFAVLVEWGYLWSFGVPRPLLASLLANGLTMSLGLWLQA